MAPGRSEVGLRQVHRLFNFGAIGATPDAQLLDRFVSRRDEAGEAAFEELVIRHGPMVLRVCRSVLQDPHDAEDAFQAVFLVLVSRARSIRRSDSIAGWLFGVAQRVAMRARRGAGRRRRLDQFVGKQRSESVLPMESVPDWEILHEEIDGLPEQLRTPLVLCYLEGLTYAAGAHQLGLSEVALRGRLARARERLRRRLIRRGVTVPSGLLVVATTGEVQAAMPVVLIHSTIRIALGFVAGNPAAVLARGVLNSMLLKQVKVAAVLSCLGIGGIVWARYAFDAAANKEGRIHSGQGFGKASANSRPSIEPRKRVVALTPPTPMTTPITVRGRAIDRDGNPVAGATIHLFSTHGKNVQLDTTTTDRDGLYSFRNTRLPVSRSQDDAPLEGTFQVYGTAPGHGFAWHGMRSYQPRRRPDDRKVTGEDYTFYGGDPNVMDLRFPPAAVLSGRIVDETGEPVPDARIRIGHCDYLDTKGKESHPNFREFWAIDGAPAALTTSKTNKDGRFRFEGLPKEAGFRLYVEHPKYAWLSLFAATTSRPTTAFEYPGQPAAGQAREPVATGELNLTVHSTRQIAVRSTFAGSGRPAPRVRVTASQGSGASGYGANGITNGDGKLQFRLPPGEYEIRSDPTIGGADCIRTLSNFKVAAKPDEQSLEVRVNPACVLILEAIDAKTGKGIPGVQFLGETDDNPGARTWVQLRTGYIDNPVSDANGRIRAVVNPGAGVFSVGHIPESAGYRPSSLKKQVALPAGQTVTLRFELEK